MSFRAWVVFLLLSIPAFGSQTAMSLSLRYRDPSFRSGILDETLGYRWFASELFDLQLASRFSQSNWNLYSVQYMAEARVHPLGFLTTRVRLAHATRLLSANTTSELLLLGEVHFTVLDHLYFFLGAGWAARPTRLGDTSPTPNFFNAQLADPTWAAELGLELRQLNGFGAKLSFGNIDALETYNLNNPFFELGVSFHPRKSALKYYLFSRYKVLLGFGRLDEFLLGFRLDWLLTRSSGG
ncbi:MAG: hypothetical protein KDD51_10010 [Bdellovibrionales bacterium]|nr:hypothetical protein [Bdellovibrionales bacterium]